MTTAELPQGGLSKWRRMVSASTTRKHWPLAPAGATCVAMGEDVHIAQRCACEHILGLPERICAADC